MTQHEEILDRMDALVDGELPAAERERVLDHLEACAPCREEYSAALVLRDETRALPRGISPPGDLWPGIAARLSERAPGAAASGAPDVSPPLVIPIDARAPRRGGRWTRWAPLAAAALLLVVLSSGITAYLMDARASAPLASAPAARADRTNSALVAFQPTEAEYLGAVETLQAALDARRGELAPATVATIEENLAIIDQAIGEARAALERDPSDPDLSLLLSGVYRKKVDLLEGALRIPARSS